MRLLPVVVGAFCVLAGCVSGSGSSLNTGTESPDSQGTILGVIVSEELFPVPNANVTVENGPTGATDERGRFELHGVAPGTHLINISAPGYNSVTQSVEVTAGGAVDLHVALQGIPGKAPYITRLMRDGLDACNISAVYTAGPIPGAIYSGAPCPFGSSTTTWKVEVGPDWRAGVHEMSWKTSEDMIFASSVSDSTKHGAHRASCQTSTTSHDWCPAMVWGKSPLHIYVKPNDTAYAAKYAIDGKETWPGGQNFTSFLVSSYSGYFQHEINNTFYNQCVIINDKGGLPKSWGCPFGIGYSTGIRFTYYHTMFYLAEPVDLRAFTALPDG